MSRAQKRARVLAIYAKVLGQKFGVDIVFSASCKTAATDGKTKIVLPPLDLGNDEDALLMEGLIDHEAGGHCRHTDFEAAERLLRSEPAMVKSLSNLLEDIWIERELIRTHPGCARTLWSVLAILDARGVWPQVDDQAHPAQAMTCLLINGLRTVKNQQDLLQQRFDGWWQVLQEQIGFDLVSEIWRTAADGIDTVSDSVAAIHLAKKLHALMQQPPAPPPAPSPSPSANGASNAQSGQSGQQRQDPGNPDPQGTPDGNPSSGSGTPGHGQPQSPQQQANAKAMANANAQQAGASEMGSIINAALTGKQPDPNAGHVRAPQGSGSASSGGAGSSWTLGQRQPLRDQTENVTVNEVARPLAVQLGSKLDALLTTQVEESSELRRSGRRVVRRLLPSVVSANRTQVFKHTDEVEGIDTALMILTDISGSMSGGLADGVQRITAASAATQALGDVLNRFDVPFAIRYFGGMLTPVKGFEQPWRSARSLTYRDLEGSTVTHSALAEVIPELAQRPERRRLLLVITDGLPSDTERTVAALQEAQAIGLEPAVLVINDGHPALAQFQGALQTARIPAGSAAQSAELAKAMFSAVTAAVH